MVIDIVADACDAGQAAQSDLDLSMALRSAARWPHDPGLLNVAPIKTLLAEGADLALDVVPVVAAKSRYVNERSKWTYFVEAIREHWQRRIAPPPITIDAKHFPESWKAWRQHFEATGQTSRVVLMEAMGYYTVPEEFPAKETIVT